MSRGLFDSTPPPLYGKWAPVFCQSTERQLDVAVVLFSYTPEWSNYCQATMTQ